MTGKIAFALAALLVGAGPAAAAELPPRAPGLWETSVGAGGSRSAIKDCVGPTDRGFAQRLAGSGCAIKVAKASNGHLIESACSFAGGMAASARILVRGDYRTRVDGEVSNQLLYAQTNKVLSRGKTTFESRRLGECRPSGR